VTPDQTELRLRCLELAVRAGAPELREQFLAFVTGESDAEKVHCDVYCDESIFDTDAAAVVRGLTPVAFRFGPPPPTKDS
jgi:hypothetical protein